MSNLAIDGGIPVFGGKKASEFVPEWPIPFPETESKLIEVFRSRKWGGCGPYEQELMTKFAAWQGSKYAAWMANGTVTLECALLALGVGPGDEVIVPGVSWIATAEAVVYVRAKPVIVDIDPETLCLDPARIEEAITPRTKAIIPVHLFSAVADMDKIMAIAEKHHLFVVEDCAHAHGAKQHERGVGAIGQIGSFSFQLSKLMTAGEGGCCTTNDPELNDRIFRASHIGNSKLHPKEPLETGFICHQYRFTEFQAAVISVQLDHQEELKQKRAANAALLRDALKEIPGIRMQESSYPDDERAYYFLTFLLDSARLKPGVTRAWIYKALLAEGVLFHEGWGCPLYRSAAWNVPENMFIKKDTPVCEDVMYNRVVIGSNTLLLSDAGFTKKVAECFDKVMHVAAE